MALDYSNRYPGQTVPDAAYPQGKARNITVSGDGTGTPWEKDLVNDLFGLFQSLLTRGSVIPSGSPDSVTSPQYFNAMIKAVRGPQIAANWDQQNIEAPVTNWGGVAWSPTLKLFAACGSAGEIETSINGRDWITRVTPGTALLFDIIWASGLNIFVAVGVGGVDDGIYVSSNGIDWSSSPNTTVALTCIAYDATLGLVAGGGVGELWHSANGVDWDVQVSGTTETFNGFTFGEGLYLGVCTNNVTVRSTTGTSGWTLGLTNITGASLQDVVYSSDLDRWIVVGLGGVITRSPNGIGSWTDVSNASNAVNLQGITWSSELGIFVAVGSTGRVSLSRAGTSWTDMMGASATANLRRVKYSPELLRFVSVATNTSGGIEASHSAGPLIL